MAPGDDAAAVAALPGVDHIETDPITRWVTVTGPAVNSLFYSLVGLLVRLSDLAIVTRAVVPRWLGWSALEDPESTSVIKHCFNLLQSSPGRTRAGAQPAAVAAPHPLAGDSPDLGRRTPPTREREPTARRSHPHGLRRPGNRPLDPCHQHPKPPYDGGEAACPGRVFRRGML
jgi:hypothetical protein